MSSLLVGFALVMGSSPVTAEEDPFGPPPPLPPESAEPKPRPISVLPAPPVPTVARRPATPSAAEKLIHERAAQEAAARKARIQQRRQSSSPATPMHFPTTGPLSHPALFRIDRGIPVAFRPIALAGIDPLPNPRPMRSPNVKPARPARMTPEEKPHAAPEP